MEGTVSRNGIVPFADRLRQAAWNGTVKPFAGRPSRFTDYRVQFHPPFIFYTVPCGLLSGGGWHAAFVLFRTWSEAVLGVFTVTVRIVMN